MAAGKQGHFAIFCGILCLAPLLHGGVESGPRAFLIGVACLLLAASFLAKNRVAFQLSPPMICLGVFWIWALLSLIWSISPQQSVNWLLLLAAYSAIFLLAMDLLEQPIRLWRLLQLLAFFSASLAFFGFVVEGLGLLGLKTFSREGALSLTFANKNHYALFLIPGCLINLVLAIQAKGSRRILHIGFFVVVFLAIVSSQSLGGMAAVVMGCLALIPLLWRIRHPILRPIFALAALPITLVMLIPRIYLSGSFLMPFHKALRPRLAMWGGTFQQWLDAPLLGTGPGTFALAHPPFKSSLFVERFLEHAHNDYFELATDLGLPGLFLALCGLLLLCRQARIALLHEEDPYRFFGGCAALASCLGMMAHAFFTFPLQIPAPAFLFAALAGGLMTLAPKASQSTVNFPRIVPVLVLSLLLFINFCSYRGDRLGKRAILAMRHKEHAQAVALLQRALRLSPFDAALYESLGDALSAGGEQDEAIEAYDRGLAYSPRRAYLVTKKAFLQQSMNREDTTSSFQQAAFLEPQNPYAWFSLGSWYQTNQRLAMAVTPYRRALFLKPGMVRAVWQELHALEGGLALFEEILPERALVRDAAARLFGELGEKERALRQLDRAYQIAPKLERAQEQTNWLVQQRWYGALLERLELFRLQYPDDLPLVLAEADAWFYSTQPAAVEHLARLSAEFPYQVSIKIMHARALQRDERLAEAEEVLTEAVDTLPYDAELHFRLGLLRLKLGRDGNAFEALRQAIQLKPDSLNYHFALAEAYRRRDLLHLAIEHYRACLEINPEHQPSQDQLQNLQNEAEIWSQP